ncbi:MAG: hypothetical protein JST31_16505 [Actinobacteria bacterium]|nr:hypothetical protein [Actinomycetota bacterium]
MSRRALVTVLAAVIALAVAIPALADSGTSARTASVHGLSKRALAKAKLALRLSRGAKRQAHRAASTATAAQAVAAGAAKSASSADEKAAVAARQAEEAKGTVAAGRPQVGFAAAAVSTGSEAFVELDGGPAVTLTVPQSGLIQVWAQATLDADGAVALYEDGRPMPGQGCEPSSPPGSEVPLFAAPGGSPGETFTVGTPAGPSCGSFGPPGPVLFQTSPGRHEYELRYASCGCEPPPAEATFSERRLVVQALP